MTHDFMENEARRLWTILDEHRSSFDFKFQEATSKVAYEQYGLGGLPFHRGYYCPTMIFDIIVGNCTRGRLRKVSPGKVNYIYGFDDDSHLITVKKYYEDGSYGGREFILREGHTEIGIGSEDLENTRLSISECKYNGSRLLSYAYGQFSPCGTDLREEYYTYLKDVIQVDLYSLFMLNTHQKVEKHEKYYFYVEKGYLVSYTVERYIGDSCKKDNRVFKSLKRRIPGY